MRLRSSLSSSFPDIWAGKPLICDGQKDSPVRKVAEFVQSEATCQLKAAWVTPSPRAMSRSRRGSESRGEGGYLSWKSFDLHWTGTVLVDWSVHKLVGSSM